MLRYEMMLPHQIRTAIEKRWPVILPLGVLEYHGEHLPVGMDTLAVTGILEILEKEKDLVILPHSTTAPRAMRSSRRKAMGIAAGRRRGSLALRQGDVSRPARIGFRNIHVVIHHQTENFAAGMPTDLAFKFAGRQAIFAFLEKDRGEGWWGSNEMADYYARQSAGEDPFNWIKTHPLMTPGAMEGYPYDHAGKGETSLMMALFPDAVDLSRLSDEKWYVRSAKDASLEFGARGRDRILAHLRVALR